MGPKNNCVCKANLSFEIQGGLLSRCPNLFLRLLVLDTHLQPCPVRHDLEAWARPERPGRFQVRRHSLSPQMLRKTRQSKESQVLPNRFRYKHSLRKKIYTPRQKRKRRGTKCIIPGELRFWCPKQPRCPL